MYRFLVLLTLFFFPIGTYAAPAPASFSAAHSLLIASSSVGNVYATGVSVVLTAPVTSDFCAIGGSIISAAPIAGDGLLIAGSISSRAPIAGDLRAVGGSIEVQKPVAGDLVALGVSVDDESHVGGSVLVGAVKVAVMDGASGPVTIYGNDISLSGNFADDVTIFSSGHLTVATGTIIHGKLSYEAPTLATISASAQTLGGVEYTNAAYLPNPHTSQALTFVSIGVFLLVRILGALILAGLLAGLFPKLAEAITERVYVGRARGVLLTLLLGFAAFVATPVLLLVLLLTFVGIGVALLLFVAYALLAVLAFVYSGILLGSVLARQVSDRAEVLWRDGVIGMLALSLLALIPFVGLFIVFFVSMFSAGALLLLFFSFAFPSERSHTDLVS
jgi:hypothetical protein